MAFDKTKKYKTVSGHPYRNYATDGLGTFPIHGAYFSNGSWIPISHSENLKNHSLFSTSPTSLELVEVDPIEELKNLKIDTLIMIRDTDHETWSPRYYAGYTNAANSLRIHTFFKGTTSITVREIDRGTITTPWKQWRLPEPGEIVPYVPLL